MKPSSSASVNTLRVLYLDYSLGFGGAVKSLSLTLSAMPSVEKYVITSQDPAQIKIWFPHLRVWSFRRLVNYRTTRRIAERLPIGHLRKWTLKAMAGADIIVTAINTAWLAWFVKWHRIDIVHLNNGFLPPEALAVIRLLQIPTVVHLRDFPRDTLRLKPASVVNLRRVIGVSDAVSKSLDGTPIAPSRRTTVHDPVDLDRIARASVHRQRVRLKCGLRDDAIAVGIFGRVVAWKGQLEFVLAMREAMKADPRLVAIIVGDSSDGGEVYMEKVRAAIESSDLAEQFLMTGYQENVEEFYASMDIVVHASISPEPFGMVVPEAMAAGCAVIAADAGGPREIIDPGVDGLLVPAGDIVALSRAVLTLAEDLPLRERLGAAAKLKAISQFGIAKSAERVSAVYAEIATSRSVFVETSLDRSTLFS